jgi:hypothetical protein
VSDQREAECADTVPEGADAETKRLIPQPHGGALLPPPKHGEVRNPKGRPPDAERLLARMLRRHAGVLDRAADELARVLCDGDHRHWLGALREALDRSEGPVTQAHAHHVSTDRAIVVHESPPLPPSLP